MYRSDVQDRINQLRAAEARAVEYAAVGAGTGIMLGALALTGQIVAGDTKAAIGLALGSGVSLACGAFKAQEADSAKQQVATYEAAQYVVDQIQQLGTPEVE